MGHRGAPPTRFTSAQPMRHRPVEKRSRWVKWENVRRGGFDPGGAVKEIDIDGVDGELLYPTPRLSNGIWWNRGDAEFQTALIRAYNDGLSEYCSNAPDRLFGLAMMPCCGLRRRSWEFHRALALPGIRGIVIGGYPSGGHYVSPADDPLWAEAQAADIPIGIPRLAGDRARRSPQHDESVELPSGSPACRIGSTS